MKLFSKVSAAGLCTLLLGIAAPSNAAAGGGVHIDTPLVSVGHYHKHKRKYRHKKRHYHRRHHYRDDYYHRRHHYRDDYYPRRHYRKHRRHHRYYDNDYRYNYYYGGRHDYRYPRHIEICPIVGFSTHYQRNRGCYRHKDHYHCPD